MKTLVTPHIVLVEDSLEDEELSLRGISKSGIACSVTVRRDGAEALIYLLGAESPALSLILLDYNLPNLTGLEILAKLRRNVRTRLVPVVIVSGTNGGSTLAECYRSGANSCVAKPDDPAEYVHRLSELTRYWLSINQPSEAVPRLKIPSRQSVSA